MQQGQPDTRGRAETYGKARTQNVHKPAQPFFDKPEHSIKVVKIVEILQKSFHYRYLADDRQQWADSLWVGTVRLAIFHGRMIAFLGMCDSTMKQLPALASRLAL